MAPHMDRLQNRFLFYLQADDAPYILLGMTFQMLRKSSALLSYATARKRRSLAPN